MEQVTAIGEQLAVTSPAHAEVVMTNLFDRVRQPVDYPKPGPVYKQAGLPQVRELYLKNHRIVGGGLKQDESQNLIN